MKILLGAAGVLVLASLLTTTASAQVGAGKWLPDNIKIVDADLQPVLADMLAASDTLRHQFQAIGHAEHVVVTFTKTTSPIHDYARPRVQLRKYDTGMILAQIEMPPLARAEYVARRLARVVAEIDRGPMPR